MLLIEQSETEDVLQANPAHGTSINAGSRLRVPIIRVASLLEYRRGPSLLETPYGPFDCCCSESFSTVFNFLGPREDQGTHLAH